MKHILLLVPALLWCSLSFAQNTENKGQTAPAEQEKTAPNTTADSTAVNPKLKNKRVMPLRPGMTTPVEAPKENNGQPPQQQAPAKKED